MSKLVSAWSYLAGFFGLDASHRARPRPPARPGPRRTWLVMPTGWATSVRVEAVTRSEARAEAKRALGLKGRLPVGTRLERGELVR